jgi:hypothetical protein
MRRFLISPSGIAIAAAVALVASAALGDDKDDQHTFKATLRGWQETPAIVTVATGTLHIRIAPDDSSIEYQLTFSDLEAPSLFAHIHVGERAVAGGVSAFLCGGGNKPACPTTSGTITGTILASDIIGPIAQGVGMGRLDRLLSAIRAGAAYANVHSTFHPAGEIRGQLVHGDDDAK